MGLSDEAYMDVLILMRMTKATDSCPTLIGAMMGANTEGEITDLFWQGTLSKSWSEPQIEGFRDFFVSSAIWKAVVRGLCVERVAISNDLTAPEGVPSSHGLVSDNAAVAEAIIGEMITWFDPATNSFDVRKAQQYLDRGKGWVERVNPVPFLCLEHYMHLD